MKNCWQCHNELIRSIINTCENIKKWKTYSTLNHHVSLFCHIPPWHFFTFLSLLVKPNSHFLNNQTSYRHWNQVIPLVQTESTSLLLPVPGVSGVNTNLTSPGSSCYTAALYLLLEACHGFTWYVYLQMSTSVTLSKHTDADYSELTDWLPDLK